MKGGGHGSKVAGLYTLWLVYLTVTT